MFTVLGLCAVGSAVLNTAVGRLPKADPPVPPMAFSDVDFNNQVVGTTSNNTRTSQTISSFSTAKSITFTLKNVDGWQNVVSIVLTVTDFDLALETSALFTLDGVGVVPTLTSTIATLTLVQPLTSGDHVLVVEGLSNRLSSTNVVSFEVSNNLVTVNFNNSAVPVPTSPKQVTTSSISAFANLYTAKLLLQQLTNWTNVSVIGVLLQNYNMANQTAASFTIDGIAVPNVYKGSSQLLLSGFGSVPDGIHTLSIAGLTDNLNNENIQSVYVANCAVVDFSTAIYKPNNGYYLTSPYVTPFEDTTNLSLLLTTFTGWDKLQYFGLNTTNFDLVSNTQSAQLTIDGTILESNVYKYPKQIMAYVGAQTESSHIFQITGLSSSISHANLASCFILTNFQNISFWKNGINVLASAPPASTVTAKVEPYSSHQIGNALLYFVDTLEGYQNVLSFTFEVFAVFGNLIGYSILVNGNTPGYKSVPYNGIDGDAAPNRKIGVSQFPEFSTQQNIIIIYWDSKDNYDNAAEITFSNSPILT